MHVQVEPPFVPIKSAFFDVDGTLDDSNDGHARSWCDVFAQNGFDVAYERVRPLIGMGGDKLLAALDIGVEADSERGKQLVAQRKAIFTERYLPGVKAFAGARDLVAALRAAGVHCIVASSASPEELDPLLEIANVRELFEHAVMPDDIERTKPDPDIVRAALAVSGTSAQSAVMIGDTRYDIEAAQRSGVRSIAFRCGGSSDDELRAADAIFDSPAALLDALAGTTLAELLATRGSAA